MDKGKSREGKSERSTTTTPQEDIIRDIRSEYGVASAKTSQLLQNSLKILAVEIYSNGDRFLFELIQNAEDNSYADGVEPTLTFFPCEGGPFKP